MRGLYRILASLIISGYFLVSVATLGNYGANWDEFNHSTRGQAYLYYFLTGKKQYDQSLFTPDQRHSFYQMTDYDFNHQMRIEGGHPALSDILSSLFNLIFYQKLGIIGDIEAYHLYGVVIVTAFLVFLYWWTKQSFGGFAAFVSVLTLILYPLFYGESHFNVQKDIPETVYMTVAALAFYTAYTQRSARWMIITGMLGGLALGTKFNVIFLALVVGLWFLIVGWKGSLRQLLRATRKFQIAITALPLIAFIIFYASWPWLWQDPINNILSSLGYYREMGIITTPSMPRSYYILGLNTYALQWILFTTPLVTLFLTLAGIWWVLRHSFKEKNEASLYIFLLFLVPIARVSLPFTSIYGGVRQIMEYVPAMAILAGIGAKYLLEKYKSYIRYKHYKDYSGLFQIAVILSFLPITLKMVQIHPNESVYFNPLIGGLKGAAERNIPGWGNSLGSTYRQGVRWLNAHAEKGARVALAFELMSALPYSEFRSDILFSNTYRSGPKREGEYMIGVTHEGAANKYLNYRYAQRFLEPVYSVNVDGVPILKVWKNDEQHTKSEYLTRSVDIKGIRSQIVGSTLHIEFPGIVRLTSLQIYFNEDMCELPREGHLFISEDGHNWWEPFPGTILEPSSYNWLIPHKEKGRLLYLFADDRAKFLRITQNSETSCLRKYPVSVHAKGVE